MKKILFFGILLFNGLLFSQQTMFAPYEGFSQTPITVTITSDGINSGTVYYTTNGQTPTLTSTSGQAPVNVPISTTTTFKAFYVLKKSIHKIKFK